MICTIKITPNMSCEYICQRVQELVNYHNKHNQDLTDSMITIEIKKPQYDTDMIPKIEFTN
jgi:hypothetical protein